VKPEPEFSPQAEAVRPLAPVSQEAPPSSPSPSPSPSPVP
jgi:hypothetical protein